MYVGVAAPDSPDGALTPPQTPRDDGATEGPCGPRGRVTQTRGLYRPPSLPLGGLRAERRCGTRHARAPNAGRPRTTSSAAVGAGSGPRRIRTHSRSHRDRRHHFPDLPRRHAFFDAQQRRHIGLSLAPTGDTASTPPPRSHDRTAGASGVLEGSGTHGWDQRTAWRSTRLTPTLPSAAGRSPPVTSGRARIRLKTHRRG